MNRFKNFFSSKSRKADELDRFMSAREDKENQENERRSKPGKSRRMDPRDMNATSCYHTVTSPKKRTGPKSCPGGYKDDDTEGGITNRSFDKEFPPTRARRSDREFARESTRNRRQNRTLSEFGEDIGSSRMNEFRQSKRRADDVIDESDEELGEENMLRELKKKNDHLKMRLLHEAGRHSYYKDEMKTLQRMNKQNEEFQMSYMRQIEELKKQNMMLQNSVKNLTHQINQMLQQSRFDQFNGGSMGGGSFAVPFAPLFANQRMFPAYQNQGPMSCDRASSFVADPQPTRTDIGSLSAPFASDDLDEIKNFRCHDYSSSQAHETSGLLSDRALDEL